MHLHNPSSNCIAVQVNKFTRSMRSARKTVITYYYRYWEQRPNFVQKYDTIGDTLPIAYIICQPRFQRPKIQLPPNKTWNQLPTKLQKQRNDKPSRWLKASFLESCASCMLSVRPSNFSVASLALVCTVLASLITLFANSWTIVRLSTSASISLEFSEAVDTSSSWFCNIKYRV